MTDTRLQQNRLIAAAIDIVAGLVLLIVLWIGAQIIGAIARVALNEFVVTRYLWRFTIVGASMASLAYVLARDVLAGGRSLGKKLQDIRVVTGAGRITLVESVKRNAIFCACPVILLLSATVRLVPFLGEHIVCVFIPLNILGVIASVAAMIVEVIKITQDPYGIRFGDQLANTRVVE